MTGFVLDWIVCAAVLIAVDLAWLGVIARRFYRRQIGHILAKKLNIVAAITFYAVYPVGIVLFAVSGVEDWQASAQTGALFGFFCYATYNLTNQATLRGWPPGFTLVDIVWGTTVTGLAAACATRLSPLLAAFIAGSGRGWFAG